MENCLGQKSRSRHGAVKGTGLMMMVWKIQKQQPLGVWGAELAEGKNTARMKVQPEQGLALQGLEEQGIKPQSGEAGPYGSLWFLCAQSPAQRQTWGSCPKGRVCGVGGSVEGPGVQPEPAR